VFPFYQHQRLRRPLGRSGDHTIADEMGETRVRGLHRIEVRDQKGEVSEATLEIRYRRIRAADWKAKPIPSFDLDGHSCRGARGSGRQREDRGEVNHRLPVQSTQDVVEKLD
jgi:hypothetical protein